MFLVRTRTHADPRTEHDGHIFEGFWKRVRHTELWEDDNRTVERRTHPGDMGVPEQCAPLSRYGEIIYVALSCLDRALRDVRRPVRPTRPELPHAVPAPKS